MTMQYLLHKQSMDHITASIPSLKEIFKSKFQEKVKCYFQFRYLFQGRSFCTLDYPTFKNSIKNLTYALNQIDWDYTKIIEDSALF